MGETKNILVCDNCNQTFLCNDWRGTKTTNAKDKGLRKNIFCSRKCGNEYQKKNNPNYLPCEICGKLSYIKKSKQNKIKHHCCSYECSAKMRKKIFSGENNHQYGLLGRKNSSWKEKEHVNTGGYIFLEANYHPFKNCNNKILEHRLIAEKYLLTEESSITIDGIKHLSPNYHVHHKDGNKKNNSVENLQIMTKSEHMSFHAQERKKKRTGGSGVSV